MLGLLERDLVVVILGEMIGYIFSLYLWVFKGIR